VPSHAAISQTKVMTNRTCGMKTHVKRHTGRYVSPHSTIIESEA
jgi:hypothetical protein